MLKRSLILTILLPILLFFPATARAGEVFHVDHVRVDGLETLTKAEVMKVLWSKPASWKPWVKKQVFEAGQAGEDAENIKKLLESQGFFDGNVEVLVKENEKRRLVDLTFTVTEGPPTIVRSFAIEGMDDLSETLREGVQKRVLVETGQRFRVPPYRETKDRIAAYLKNHGYPGAQVSGVVRVNKKERSAEAVLTLKPGPYTVFGKTLISGLPDTSPRLLRSRLTYKEGEPFSRQAIYESQRKLFALGCFSTVFIKPDEEAGDATAPEEGPEVLHLELTGTYRKFKGVKLGVGYGTEDKFRVQATWRHRHLAEWAQRFEITAKASSLIQSLEATLGWPYFLHPDQEMHDTLGLSREDETSYTVKRLYNTFTVSRALHYPYHVQAAHLLEIDRPEELPTEEILRDIREDSNYLISTLRIGADRDSRTPVFDPVEGSLVQAWFSYASGLIGSEIRFFKVRAEARKIQPVAGPVLLAGRVLFASIEPTEGTETIPIFKRLFSGGSQSVRGYPYQELGPMDSEGDPTGGLSQWEASVELRFPIYKSLGGVVFSDAGSVLEDSFSFDAGEVRYTAGAGLRYATPVGPLRFDWGYQLNPQDDNRTPYRFYLSIGQAF